MSKRIALFVTCLVDQIMPEVGVATVKVLRWAGVDVVFPLAQTCCGR
ncbi:MAG: Fe-S oxidoreductase, partial [Rhodobacteraceae bacterium]|nr:Fe-S oxidoreductase [Paracoccaceae bacterium]